jgi:hypothetical protein
MFYYAIYYRYNFSHNYCWFGGILHISSNLICKGGDILEIPEFCSNGLLPTGIHSCELDDIYNAFVCINDKTIREDLYKRLVSYIEKIKKAEIPCKSLLIDGSYVTAKPNPSDIDLAIVVPHDYYPRSYTQDHYDVMHAETAKIKFGFNTFTVYEESNGFDEMVNFFQGVQCPNNNLKKGILRVRI